MALTHDEAPPVRGERATALPAGALNDPGETSGGLLRLDGPGSALVRREPKEWLLPGADEMFRRLYTRAGTPRSEVLAVCSAIAGEGKTTVSMGLAVTLAEDFPDRRVLVVETDLQKPVLAEDFGLDPVPGLAECLINDEPVEVACRATQLENLHIIPGGTPQRNPGRWLRSGNMALAVDAMRAMHDIVILDVPAMLGNSDALLLTDLADGVLFVVRAGVTPASVVSQALEDIDDGRLRGLILNGRRSAIPAWLRRLLGL
jgi:capsular exopolysaccharide synthesis family protein